VILRLIVTVVAIGLAAAAVYTFKQQQNAGRARAMGGGPPPAVVTDTRVQRLRIEAVGDITAVQDVAVAPEVSGKVVEINLGVDMDEVGATLSTLLGGGCVSRFNQAGRSYEVIPQVARRYRLDETFLEDYHVRGGDGELIPLGSFVSLRHDTEPTERAQFQQLNSVTISGLMAPGVSLVDAMTFLERTAAATLPQNIGYDYMGESRQLMQQGNALMYTFFLSLLVIYLVLAAQYESWRDPLIILVSVPMSIAGAMLFIYLGFASVNLFQMGLVIFSGLGLGTVFTLFAVPVVYVLLAKDRNPELHELQRASAEAPAI